MLKFKNGNPKKIFSRCLIKQKFSNFISEIVKVRSVLFQNNTKPLELPTPTGKTVTLSKKVFVPAKDYPDVSSKTTSNLKQRKF